MLFHQTRDENPQTLRNHLGKIHRTYDDGSIPEDNPFRN
ncbi:MAG: PQQ-dependent sugar dehydrogenase, partial [Cyclobacteriaceae bacterium]